MLGESPLALVALAGQLVVAASDTDGWETVQHGYAQLLGRGNAVQTQLAEQWLKETREQLTGRHRARCGADPRGPGGPVGRAAGRSAGGGTGRRG